MRPVNPRCPIRPLKPVTMRIPVFDVPSVPVLNSSVPFPVRRVWCVGKNYARHARELNADPADIVFFLKSAQCIVSGSDILSIPYPRRTTNLHHEIELVVALGAAGVDLTPDEAGKLVFGYAVGLDLTLRDVQNVAREKGNPWDLSKAFDRSAPIGTIVPKDLVKGDPSRANIQCSVNGQLRQSSTTDQMTWGVSEILSQLSKYVELQPGDLIFTGTPEGVGSLVPGDICRGEVEGVGQIELHIQPVDQGQVGAGSGSVAPRSRC